MLHFLQIGGKTLHFAKKSMTHFTGWSGTKPTLSLGHACTTVNMAWVFRPIMKQAKYSKSGEQEEAFLLQAFKKDFTTEMGCNKWRRISCIWNLQGPDPKLQQRAMRSRLLIMFKLLAFFYADSDWCKTAPKCHGGTAWAHHLLRKCPGWKLGGRSPLLLEKCQQADYEILEHSPLFWLSPLLPCLLEDKPKSIMFHLISSLTPWEKALVSP